MTRACSPKRTSGGSSCFTGVRNPFDSLVSLYEKIRQKYVHHLDDPRHWVNDNPRQARLMRIAVEEGFNAWLRAKYPERPAREPVFFQAPYLEGADHVIRFENLQEDFAKAMVAVGLPDVSVPRLNTTDREPDHRPYYDEWSRRRIGRLFAPTLERFGYRF